MEVREHQDAPIFNVPVDWRALGLDDYPIIVRRPMDLGTVLKRLQAVPCFYSSALDVDADIGLVWSNAMRAQSGAHAMHKADHSTTDRTHDHTITTHHTLSLSAPPSPLSSLALQSGRLLRVQHSRGPQVHHRPANGASTQRSEGGGRGGEPSQPPSAIRGPSSTRWRRRRAAKKRKRSSPAGGGGGGGGGGAGNPYAKPRLTSYKDDDDLAYLDVDDYNSSYKPKKLSKRQMAAQQEKQQGIGGGPMPTTVGEMAEGNLGAVGLGESPE